MLGNLHQLRKVLTRKKVLEVNIKANFINAGINFQKWFPPKADLNSNCLKKYEKNSSGHPSTKKTRSWSYTNFRSNEMSTGHEMFPLRVMSYNVLAQDLLESHPYLYQGCNETVLDWKYRRQNLIKEIEQSNADIICLQEVQNSHLQSFYYRELNRLGYKGIYKQRTGNRVDGVGLFFKQSRFGLVTWSPVEYYIPGDPLLDRDNVGIVARLQFLIEGWKHWQIVVATTHLLFNTRRHDVKLAQTQLLLAECEAQAFRSQGRSSGENQYWPIIITGDFNLTPYTGVYRLITDGILEYENLNKKTLEESSINSHLRLGRNLISPRLKITDTCQYVDEIHKRMKSNDSPNEQCMHQSEVSRLSGQSVNSCSSILKFSSGTLSHPLNLMSVYVHGDVDSDEAEVTSKHTDWSTVDYIFYGGRKDETTGHTVESNLKLVARYRLFTREEARIIGPIPNEDHPSDHYYLMADFVIVQ